MRHVILNFHGLGPPPLPEREPGEHRYWIGAPFFDTVLTRVAERKEHQRIDLTFDDGNLSDLTVGAEALARHGFTATFFVLADRIGLPHCLSAEDITRLQDAGHRVGSHGAAHCDWSALDAAGQAVEFAHARQRIQQITGADISEAAIPFGRYNRAVLKSLRTAGFEVTYSSDGGAVTGGTWPLPRTSVRADMTEADVVALLDGPDPVRRALRRRAARFVKRLI